MTRPFIQDISSGEIRNTVFGFLHGKVEGLKGVSEHEPLLQGGILHLRKNKSIARDFYSLAPDVPYRPLFLGSVYEPLIAYSPLIFTAGAAERALYAKLLSRTDNWGFFYRGPGSFELHNAHWRSILSVIMPDNSAAHFHFYNPSVLTGIISACTEQELAGLCGPALDLLLPLHEGRWRHVRNPGDPLLFVRARSGKGNMPKNRPWWKVRPQHLEPFSHIMDRVYRENIETRIWSESPVLAKEVAGQYGDVGAFVDQALTDAHANGFVTPEHEFRYLMLCLHYDCNVEPSWRVRRVLELAPHNPELALHSLEHELRSANHGI